MAARTGGGLGLELGALGALLAVLALELLAAGVRHRSDAELWAAFETGTPRERAGALFVLANRGEPELDRDLARELLADDDVLLRELAMTTHVTRFTGKELQRAYLARLAPGPERLRCALFLERGIGAPQGLTRAEVRAFLRAAGEGAGEGEGR